MQLAAVDFETVFIQDRPVYPPVPVGFAEKVDGRKGKYWAWGHPCENNCSKSQAKSRLKELYQGYNCIFHNSAFDITVGINHMGLGFPKSFHDTLFQAYLYDPREVNLGLKPLAEKYLDMPPEEQERLRDWVMANVPEAEKDTKDNPWNKYIYLAPAKLAGEYAIGDVERTLKLHKMYFPEIVSNDLLEAYDRELAVMPIFEEMSTQGLPIDVKSLKQDIYTYSKSHLELEKRIKVRLNAWGSELNINSGDQLADAMDRAGKVDQWIYTKPSKTFPDGKRSTARDNILACCNDKTLTDMLSKYSLLKTYLSTFMIPWMQVAENYNGHIYPNFNQTRSADSGYGTRTGRPSSNKPNLLNVPKNLDDLKDWQKGLPWMRKYITPERGQILNARDYCQQEVRILAHFEKGALYRAFINNPSMNPHHYAKELIKAETGIQLQDREVKAIVFGIIYGMGIKLLALKLGIDKRKASQVKNAYLMAFPGVKDLSKQVKLAGQNDENIITWGGRLYAVEEPSIVDGRIRTFEYKLMNYLIQGSAADVTKQAMINVYANCNDSRIMLQVYDELLVTSGNDKEMGRIKEAMEAVKLSVPLLSDGKTGRTNWAELKKCA